MLSNFSNLRRSGSRNSTNTLQHMVRLLLLLLLRILRWGVGLAHILWFRVVGNSLTVAPRIPILWVGVCLYGGMYGTGFKGHLP